MPIGAPPPRKPRSLVLIACILPSSLSLYRPLLDESARPLSTSILEPFQDPFEDLERGAAACTAELTDTIGDADPSEQLDQCYIYLTTCSAVLILAEGSAEQRRRANTQQFIGSFESSYRCMALFSHEEAIAGEGLRPMSELAFSVASVPAVCTFASTKDNLFGLLGRLSGALAVEGFEPAAQRVLLALSTHGGLEYEHKRAKTTVTDDGPPLDVPETGERASVFFGDDVISVADMREHLIRPFCASNAQTQVDK